MKFWKFLKGKRKQNHHPPTLKDLIECKHCLCFFSVSSNDHIVIKLDDDESPENEIEAEKLFELYKKQHRVVHFYNYRSGLYKLLNSNGNIIPQKITKHPIHPVDNDSLISTIYHLGGDYDNNQLPPKYFSIIFKLLEDEVLGHGYKDLKATTFRSKMTRIYGFKTEGRSSFSKYKPQGKYPNWHYKEGQFKKDRNIKIEKALEFARQFVLIYDSYRLQSKANITDKTIKTAEETTEFR